MDHPPGLLCDVVGHVVEAVPTGLGDAEVDFEPPVQLLQSGGFVIPHRLFKPVEIQLFQFPARPQRLLIGIGGRSVEHELDIVAHRLAHQPTGLNIHLHIAKGVQFDGLVAPLDAIARQWLVILDRLLGEGAGIGRHLVAISAQMLVERHARRLGSQIPQRYVECP